MTDPGGRDLIDERMRAKDYVLCTVRPMRLGYISRILVNGWKDKTVYNGLDYASRWILIQPIARGLHTTDDGLHRIPRSRVRDWLVDHPDWAEHMCRGGCDYWRRAKRCRCSRREYTYDDPLLLPAEPVPKGLVQGSLFQLFPVTIRAGRGTNRDTKKSTSQNTEKPDTDIPK